MVYPFTGLMANVWEMSTPPMLQMGHGPVCLAFDTFCQISKNARYFRKKFIVHQHR